MITVDKPLTPEICYKEKLPNNQYSALADYQPITDAQKRYIIRAYRKAGVKDHLEEVLSKAYGEHVYLDELSKYAGQWLIARIIKAEEERHRRLEVARQRRLAGKDESE